jgi:LmbE family N-acetylglucosaminyl deacetylase
MDLAALGSVVAISPHLDDAVLSAGAFLASTKSPTVVTVFAGIPPRGLPLSQWDELSGFVDGDDVVGLRRLEDTRAVGRLGGTARWLDFLDGQYRNEAVDVNEVGAGLLRELEGVRFDTIAFPLGIAHPDHQDTFQACVMLLHAHPELARRWLVWSDIPYRARHPDLVADRLEELRGRGYEPREFVVDAGAAKPAAVLEYPTQVKALGDSLVDALVPEQLFVLAGEV